jgi:hypothetical protein
MLYVELMAPAFFVAFREFTGVPATRLAKHLGLARQRG